MRRRIFTTREKEILESYINKGIQEKGFRVLKHRIKKNLDVLKEEIKLAESAISGLKK